jgi:hypothetical protein
VLSCQLTKPSTSDALARQSVLDNIYVQFAALLNVRDIAGPDVTLGPLRGMLLSPDSLQIILSDLLTRKTARPIELGAGESMIAMCRFYRRPAVALLQLNTCKVCRKNQKPNEKPERPEHFLIAPLVSRPFKVLSQL